MELKATTREAAGGRAHRLLAQGSVPAVVYGHHAKTRSIAVDQRELQHVLHRAGRTQLVDLVIDGKKPAKVLVKAIQTHPRRLGPIHVDFQEVSLREKLAVDVPIFVSGESPAVATGDGELQTLVHSVRVECLPGDIPEAIEVDATGLAAVGDGVRVGELKLPAGVVAVTDAEELVVRIAPLRNLAAELEAEEAAEAAEVEEEAEAPAAGEEPEAEAEGEPAE